MNRVRSVDNLDTNPDTPRVILIYEYDPQGNLRTWDDSGVTVQSTFTKRNQLESRKWYDDNCVPVGGTNKDVADARVDFSYSAAGRQRQILRYSDLRVNQSWEYRLHLRPSGRTDKLIHKNAVDSLLSSYDYNYDFSDC